MYILKDEFKNKKDSKDFNKLLKLSHKKQVEIAETIGVDSSYISQTANGKGISKLCAYAICKAISPNLELYDLFVIKM